VLEGERKGSVRGGAKRAGQKGKGGGRDPRHYHVVPTSAEMASHQLFLAALLGPSQHRRAYARSVRSRRYWELRFSVRYEVLNHEHDQRGGDQGQNAFCICVAVHLTVPWNVAQCARKR